MKTKYGWAIKVLEQALVDAHTMLQDDEIKKDAGRINENRVRYFQIKRAIETLKKDEL